ncbi:MAG: SLBB domain-containing protein [Nostocaceae cyanobacterium]|nr:SLBB domain-containing protein [Nostocaceae cyanobacterium]
MLILPYTDVAQAQRRNTTRRTPRTVIQQQFLSTDYTLGGGDRIRVNVFEVPEYTGEYQIPPGGAINLPLIGSVSLQGLTTEQAADIIASRYARFLKRPLISVNLLSPRPINVTVSGEVSRPGAYTISLQGGAGQDPGVQYPTVLAALTTAQGVTLSADIERVQLRRRIGSGLQTVTLNIKQIIQGSAIPGDITLRDGDSIFVPVGSLDLAEIRQLSYAGIAPDASRPRSVAIVGEVSRPGTYLVTPQGGANATGGFPNVTSALQLAGGLTTLANIDGVRLQRRTRTGGTQTLTINLRRLLQGGDINQDTLLQDGDTIVVGRGRLDLKESRLLAQYNLAPDASKPRTVAVIGEVTRPGTYVVTAEGGAGTAGGNTGLPNVTRALQLAGGVTSLADINSIRLVRRDRSGGQESININLRQLISGGDLEQDTLLQDGDTIVVNSGNNISLQDMRLLSQVNLAADPSKPRAVTLIGEVNRPGTYLVTSGSTADTGTNGSGVTVGAGGGQASVSRAIQLAGGITPLANLREITIRRPKRDGGEQLLAVNLWEVIKTGDANQDTLLQEGDTIVIPTATEINPAEATQLATTTLSPATIQVNVAGEVKRPGPVQVQPNTSLTQAILAAGGFNDARAKSTDIQLVRLNPDGSVTKRTVKVDFAAPINDQTNPIIRNNDIVLVGRSGITQVGDTIDNSFRPFNPILSILRLIFTGF